MDRDDLNNLIGDVFGPNTERKIVNGWFSMPCPLAPWTHTSGKDTRASAGISIQPNATSVFNCLRGDTEVRTYEGTRLIADLAGATHILQLPNGGWVHAPIRSFGKQKLFKVSLSRNGRKKDVYATAGHRWFAQSQGGGRHLERTTLELKPGQRMQSVAIVEPVEHAIDEAGLLHGVIFGDGTAHINGKHGRVNLYGEKAQLFDRLAATATNSGYTKDGVAYVSGEYAKFKRTAIGRNPTYFLSFVAGWIATDGNVDDRGNITISCADEGDLENLRDALYREGIETYGINESWRIGYGNEPTPIYTIRFVGATFPASLLVRDEQRARFLAGETRLYARWQWQVVSVEETGIVEEVFCAVVPKYHAFVLDGGLVTGNCYTCHTKVPLQALVKRYAEYTGEDLDALVEELEDEAYLGPRTLPAWGARGIDPSMEPPAILDKELYLDLYDSAAGHPYLHARGISDETAEYLQLKLDPRDPVDGEERILFPIFTPEGELAGFSGRATRDIPKDDRTLKVRDYGGLTKAKCLLGAHLITQEKPDKILVVEGLFDYAVMWQNGFPATAVMHSTCTPYQASLLKGFSLPVYLFYDDDDAGHSGMQIAGRQLDKYVPVMRIRYPEIWIEDDSEEGGHWVKDPGELLPEDVEAMLRDSRLF